jgi:hypothetical protein
MECIHEKELIYLIEIDQLFLFDSMEEAIICSASKQTKVDLFRLRLPNNFGLTLLLSMFSDRFYQQTMDMGLRDF